MKECPNCKLLSPQNASRCDCGFDFSTEKMEKSFIKQKPSEEEQRVLSKASGESRIKCPLDGNLMKKEVLQSIVIDRCPHCSGVFLDKEELDVISKKVQSMDFSSGILFGMAMGHLT